MIYKRNPIEKDDSGVPSILGNPHISSTISYSWGNRSVVFPALAPGIASQELGSETSDIDQLASRDFRSCFGISVHDPTKQKEDIAKSAQFQLQLFRSFPNFPTSFGGPA